MKALEFKTVLIYEIPIYKMNKKNSGVHRHIGHIRLLTNGRIINVKYKTNSKSYAILDEIFQECIVSVTSQVYCCT